MVGQHLAARGSLEGLEAGLALDRLCGRVLVSRQRLGLQIAQGNTFTYGFQLALCLLRTSISLP